MGFDLIERLRVLASLRLAGTAQTEGGGIRVANNHIIWLVLGTTWPQSTWQVVTNNL